MKASNLLAAESLTLSCSLSVVLTFYRAALCTPSLLTIASAVAVSTSNLTDPYAVSLAMLISF